MNPIKKQIINQDDNIEYMTLKDAAKHCHIGINAIRGFILGGLPSYKPRKHRLLIKSELDAYIKAKQTKIPIL